MTHRTILLTTTLIAALMVPLFVFVGLAVWERNRLTAVILDRGRRGRATIVSLNWVSPEGNDVEITLDVELPDEPPYRAVSHRTDYRKSEDPKELFTPGKVVNVAVHPKDTRMLILLRPF